MLSLSLEIDSWNWKIWKNAKYSNVSKFDDCEKVRGLCTFWHNRAESAKLFFRRRICTRFYVGGAKLFFEYTFFYFAFSLWLCQSWGIMQFLTQSYQICKITPRPVAKSMAWNKKHRLLWNYDFSYLTAERRNQNNVYHCSPTRRRTKGKIKSKISVTRELNKKWKTREDLRRPAFARSCFVGHFLIIFFGD